MDEVNHRLDTRTGTRRQFVLRTIYHMLAEGTTYQELGPDYYDRRHKQRVTRRAIQMLERLGYRVTLEVAA